MNTEKCKASFWAGSVWGGDAAVSVQCFVCSHSCLWGHQNSPCSPGTGTTSHTSPEPAQLKLSQGLGAAAGLGQQLLDASRVLLNLHVHCTTREVCTSVTPGLITSSMLSSPSPPPHHSFLVLFKGKKKKKKLAFWCWVSGYGIIQIQHLPLSYVVPKGQYLTLLLPITLCTCGGLWYYCKTL